jgi:hypothetical protein
MILVVDMSFEEVVETAMIVIAEVVVVEILVREML